MTTRRLTLPFLTSLSVLSLALVAACSDDVDPMGEDGMDETSGDGDGDDPSTSGDGDESSSGDGDGDDPSTSGDGDGDDPSTSGDGDGDGEDTTPPTVTMTTPSADAAGVLPETVIEVSFSEPMDKASVQAAWQSPDLPSDAVTFAWNDDGSVLTVTPNELLVLAEVASLDEPAEAYSFSINTAATDLAGNALEADLEVSFTTARRLTTDVGRHAPLTNYVFSDGTVGPNLDNMIIGDNNNNLGVRGFVTYAFADFPADLIAIEQVYMRLDDWMIIGAPLGPDELGSLEVHDVQFDAIQSVTYNVENDGMVTTLLTPFIFGDTVIKDVTEVVLADYDGGEDYTQFRLALPKATNSDSGNDLVSIEEPDLSLEVTVLVP